MNIGIVCSGGDSPGMNAAIRAVVRQGVALGARATGFRHGFDGILDGRYLELQAESVSGIMDHGGTWLGTGRSLRFRAEGGVQAVVDSLRSLGVDGLVVIGGDGSIRGAQQVHERGVAVLCVPATIDNDVYGTEATIGYDTCLNTILDAISKLRDTASSHNRVFVLEVMGRDSGELALNAGLAGGAELVVVPEMADPVETVYQAVEYGRKRGKLHTVIVVAEGSVAADELAEELNDRCQDREVRTSVLGHIQRGGRPSARDCIIASRMGARAVGALMDGDSGLMVGIEGERLTLVPLLDVISGKKEVDLSLLDLIGTLGM